MMPVAAFPVALFFRLLAEKISPTITPIPARPFRADGSTPTQPAPQGEAVGVNQDKVD
jgi:hypothetical protein